MATRFQSTTRWLRWLTPGLEIKRWLLLLMLAELVLVLGLAYILKAFYETATLPGQFYYITLQFLPHWLRAIIFGTLGVGLLIYSYVKLTQSVLGPFLPGNSTASVVDVIHAFRLKGRGPRIVAIGGGTGLSSLLRGLKTYTSNLTAMADVTGNFEHALRESGKVLAVKGTIVPSTLQDVTLVASINGRSVEGESKIPKQNAPIRHVILKPEGAQENNEA